MLSILLSIIFISIIFAVVLILIYRPGSTANFNQSCANMPCADGFTCTNNLCLKNNGQSCINNGECSSNNCHNSICQTQPSQGKTFPIQNGNHKIKSDVPKAIFEQPKILPKSPPKILPKDKTCVVLKKRDTFYIKPPKYSNNSSDDEENSIGDDYSDLIINSGESSQNSDFLSEDLKTPCQEDENFEMQCGNSWETVIDVTSHSHYTLFLLDNGTIISKCTNTGTKNKHEQNIKVEKIVSFSGYLFGLSKGILYCSYNPDKIQWRQSNIKKKDIYHISATADGEYLWIQDYEKGYLYSDSFNVTEERYLDGIRIYGPSIDSYLEIKNNVGSVYFKSKLIKNEKNVYSGVLMRGNEAKWLYHGDNNRGISLVNHKPYYLK